MKTDAMRKQGDLGQSLVKQWLEERFPPVKATTWQDLAGSYSLAMSNLKGKPFLQPRRCHTDNIKFDAWVRLDNLCRPILNDIFFSTETR